MQFSFMMMTLFLNMNNLSDEQIIEEAEKLKKVLDKYDMKAEFVAPWL